MADRDAPGGHNIEGAGVLLGAGYGAEEDAWKACWCERDGECDCDGDKCTCAGCVCDRPEVHGQITLLGD